MATSAKVCHFDPDCLLIAPCLHLAVGMTTVTLGLVIIGSFVMAAIMFGCMPTVVAWYCCVRNGGPFSGLFGGAKVSTFSKDDL